MKYLAYILLVIAFVVGHQSWHPLFIPSLALGATLMLTSVRRKHVKARPHTENVNMVLDGAFLFAVQLLIMFTVYILGYFIANRVPIGPV